MFSPVTAAAGEVYEHVSLWVLCLCMHISRQCSFTVTDISVFSDPILLSTPPWSFLFSWTSSVHLSSRSVVFSFERNFRHLIPLPAMPVPSEFPHCSDPLQYCFNGLNKCLEDAFIYLGGSSMGGPYRNQTLKWCNVSVGLYQSSCKRL